MKERSKNAMAACGMNCKRNSASNVHFSAFVLFQHGQIDSKICSIDDHLTSDQPLNGF